MSSSAAAASGDVPRDNAIDHVREQGIRLRDAIRLHMVDELWAVPGNNGLLSIEYQRRISYVSESTSMVRAVVNHGEIRPLEPLPADWRDGQPLRIEKEDDGEPPVEEIDRDFEVLAALCQTSDPADEAQLERALQEARRQSKEQVRRQMGLA